MILKKCSDNRILSNFIDSSIGCLPFQAPDLADLTILRSSSALNEIQANLIITNLALVPSNDEMVLDNGNQSLLKLNLYRQGVNQPTVSALNDQINIDFCNGLMNIGIPFLILYQNEFTNFASPDFAVGSNLLNFLCQRFINTWVNIKCPSLINLPSPITVIIEQNSGTAIGNNLNILSLTTTVNPYAIPTTTVIPGSQTTLTVIPGSQTTTSSLIPGSQTATSSLIPGSQTTTISQTNSTGNQTLHSGISNISIKSSILFLILFSTLFF